MRTSPPATGDNQIVLYRADDGQTQIDVHLQEETIWLSQKQISVLFGKDTRTINEHILNIFKEGELRPRSVIRKFRITAADGKSYATSHYNLDVVISVGYRVKSLQGTKFRIWATNVLRKHLIEGYTLHQKRLQERGTKELEQALALIARTKELPDLSSDQAKGLLDIVTRYTQTWLLLRKFDDAAVEMPRTLRSSRSRC